MNEQPFSIDNTAQIAPQEPTVEPSQPIKSNNRVFAGSLTVLILFAVAVGGYWFYRTYGFAELASQRQVAEQQMASPEILPQESKPLLFVRDWSLWQSVQGVETQLSAIGQAVLAFEISPDGEYIAYTVGELKANSVGYQYVFPHTLVLYNTETDQSTTLFSLEVSTDLEYEYRLVDLAFSHDSKQLAFSTSNNVYVHSFDTNTTEPLFGETTATQAKSSRDIPIFGYNGMSFSPADTYLYVRRGFYEGMEPIVISLQTKAEIPIPLADKLGGYGGYLLDWYDEHSLAAVKDLEAQREQAVTELLQLSIKDQSVKRLATVQEKYSLFGAYQLGELRLFAAVQPPPGEETNVIVWVEIDPQTEGLQEVASFQMQSRIAFDAFEVLNENVVLYEAKNWSESRSQLYTYDKAANQSSVLKDGARLSAWR